MKFDVICIGSASIDTFIRSSSSDIHIRRNNVSLPIGGKILVDELAYDVGGSGVNTSVSFSRLGLRSAFLGKLGRDFSAEQLKERLRKEDVKIIDTYPEGKTGQSFILSGLNNDRTILTYKGSNDLLSEKDIRWKKLDTRWIYLGTLTKLSWNTEVSIAEYAKKKGVRLMFNPSLYLARKGLKTLTPVLDACSILVLNKEEAQSLAGKLGSRMLLKRLQRHVPLVVITDGPNGASAYDGRKFYNVAAHKVKVVDPTGAGDAFASGFLSAVIRGYSVQRALDWGLAQSESVLGAYGATNNLLTKNQMVKKC